MTVIKDLLEIAVSEFVEKTEALATLIWQRMEEVARKEGVDTMVFTHMGNCYSCDGEEMEVRELETLDELFLNHINSGGFEAVWKWDKGWC